MRMQNSVLLESRWLASMTLRISSRSKRTLKAMPGGESVNTITFSETTGRTAMTILVQHSSKANRDAHINSGIEAGMKTAIDLLEQVAVSLG
jgi:hypothetical protein